jgi:Flp pilus assembly protein TadG
MLRNQQRRSGATLVECAIVYPITLLFVLGLIIGAMGIFRYQEMASLARETARYAAVHGTQYALDAGVTAPTPDQIFQAVVPPRAAGLDLTKLSYNITYNTNNAPAHIVVQNGDVTPFTNTVTVTLTYQWLPEAFLGGVTLSSTAQIPMSY